MFCDAETCARQSPAISRARTAFENSLFLIRSTTLVQIRPRPRLELEVFWFPVSVRAPPILGNLRPRVLTGRYWSFKRQVWISELKASQVYRTRSRTAMASQKNLSRKKKKKKFQASLIYRETLSQKRCVCVCVCGAGGLSQYFMCILPSPANPLFPYNNKCPFLSSHYPTTTTALLRSSFNTRKYQQCVEILCFNELLK